MEIETNRTQIMENHVMSTHKFLSEEEIEKRLKNNPALLKTICGIVQTTRQKI